MTAPSEGTKDAARLVNVPNVLTAMRLLLAVLVFVLVPLGQYVPALVLFLLAAGTDWIDGYWARRFGQITQFGRIFDPFADKIIICGVFAQISVELAAQVRQWPWVGACAAWITVVVVGRELLVTALRSIIEKKGGDFSAAWSGKVKMVLQCLAAAAALAFLQYHVLSPDNTPLWVVGCLAAAAGIAAISTIYSGIGYVSAAARFLRQV